MKLSIVSLVLAGLVSFTATAHADEIDAALDRTIGLPTTIDATAAETPATTTHRDPATVGTLTTRRPVDLAAQDDDAGHRILVETVAPAPVRHGHRHGHRSHHRGLASR